MAGETCARIRQTSVTRQILSARAPAPVARDSSRQYLDDGDFRVRAVDANQVDAKPAGPVDRKSARHLPTRGELDDEVLFVFMDVQRFTAIGGHHQGDGIAFDGAEARRSVRQPLVFDAQPVCSGYRIVGRPASHRPKRDIERDERAQGRHRYDDGAGTPRRSGAPARGNDVPAVSQRRVSDGSSFLPRDASRLVNFTI